MLPRFRQRLLLHDEVLEETANVHSPTDLHLLLLPFAVVSQSRANDLAAAAERGSARKVESMLQLPQDSDIPDMNGCTASRRPSRAGRVGIVRLLLEASASLDLAGINGCTPLMKARGGEIWKSSACCWKRVLTRMWQTTALH